METLYQSTEFFNLVLSQKKILTLDREEFHPCQSYPNLQNKLWSQLGPRNRVIAAQTSDQNITLY